MYYDSSFFCDTLANYSSKNGLTWFDAFKAQAYEISDEINGIFTKIENLSPNNLQEFTNNGWKPFIEQNKIADETLVKFLNDANQTDKSLEAFKLYPDVVNKTGKAFNFAAIGAKAFNIALNLGIMLLVVKGIELVSDALDNYINRNEIAIETAAKANENIKSISNSFKDHKKLIDDYASTYDSLSKGIDKSSNKNLSLNTEDYEKYLDINKQFAEAFPSLITGFDEQGNAILSIGTNGATSAVELEKLLASEKELANYKISQNIDDAFKGLSVNISEATKEADNFNLSLEEINNSIKNIADLNSSIQSFNKDDSFFKIDATKDGAKEYAKAVQDALKEMGAYTPETEIQYAPQDSITGADTEYFFNLYSLSDEQLSQLKDRMKEQTNDLNMSFKDSVGISENGIKEQQQKLELAWKDFIPSLMATSQNSASYKELGEQVQSAVDSMISNLNVDQSQLIKKDYSGNVQSYIREQIIKPIYYAEPEVKSAYAKLFSLDPNTFKNFDSYEKQVNSLVENIVGKDKDKQIEFKAKFNLDNLDSQKEAIQKKMNEKPFKMNVELSKQEVISNINSLSEGFESLDKIMKSISDKDNPFDYALLDDKKFKENFNGLGEAYTDFIEKVSSSPKDINVTKSAFNDLVTTWIDSSGVLNGLTNENANFATSMLQNMGIANAEEVVMSRLAIEQEHLAAQKAYTAEVSNDLANATASEIPGIIDEATQSDIAKVALAGLVLEKEFFNGNSLDTSGDIENILSLVGVIGSANTALQALNTLKANGNVGYRLGKEGYDTLVKNAQQEVDDAIKAASEYKGKGGSTNASYTGGTKTNKPSSGSKKDKKDFSEVFDWVETTIKRVDEKIQDIQSKISDTSNWKPKNTITDTAIDEMANKLTALQSQLDTYQKKAGSYNLSPTYIDKIKNGTLEIETITDEVIANNIKGYQEWYNKAEDVRKKIDDTKKAMKELAQTKLDNIINDFDSLVSLMDKYASYSNNLLNLQKELGESITNTDYKQLINQQESIYKQLQSKYNTLSDELSKAVSKGTIKAGSEEWRKYQEELITVNSSMNDAVSSMNDFRKALLNLPFEELEQISGVLDRINNGINTMSDLIGDDGLIDGGMLTSKGLAKIALLGQQYANAKQQAADYGEAINAINKMYENGSLTQAEYNEKLNESTNAQLSAVKATKEAEQAILQFRYNAIQAQIDDMNELISAKKKALQTEKDYQDYLDGINNKQTDINNLQTKIDELSLSTDRKDIAQRLQLEQQLSDAKKDLAKTQADYAYDKTIESLDKQASDYEDAKKKELEELKSNADAQKKVIEEYLGQVKDNYKTVYNTLTKYGSDYNVTMTSELTSPWESANSALSTFKDAVSDAISQINIDIANIDLSRLTELVSTMQGFSAGGNGTASFEDITGSGTWQKNSNGWWYGASNDDYASDGIYTIGGKQYSFNEDGYMKTGWDDSNGDWRYFEPENGQMVKSAWRKSKDGKNYYLKSDGTMAIDMAVKAKDGNGYYYVDDNGVWDEKTISYDDVKKRNIAVGYKNGTTNSKPGLKYVNEDGPELIVAKNGTVLNSVGGDTIFTKSMTDKLWDFAIDPSKFVLSNMPKYDYKAMAMANRNNVSMNIDSPLLVVQGNADKEVLTQMNERLNAFINKEIPQKMMEMSKQY